MVAAKPCLGHHSRSAAVRDLRGQQLTTRQIADRIGVPPKSVAALERGQGPDRRRKLTADEIEQAAELRERGLTIGQIARKLSTPDRRISEGAISWHCLKLGADLPPARRKNAATGRQPVRRGNHVVRPFTPEEDETLLRLASEGQGPTAIARQLGTNRKSNSITGRLMTLARHQARLEDFQ